MRGEHDKMMAEPRMEEGGYGCSTMDVVLRMQYYGCSTMDVVLMMQYCGCSLWL